MNAFKHFKTVLNSFFALCLVLTQASAATKTSVANGNWGTNATWSPSGAPAAGDVVIIANGTTVTVTANATISAVTVNAGGTLQFSGNKTLTISSASGLTVNGTCTISGGDITLSTSGATFAIGSTGTVTWNPSTNTSGGATLFTNGTESFNATSTLIISKWYDYAVPLTNVITGNFGNLSLSTVSGASIMRWKMNNGFQTHQVQGTLTVNSGWVVLDTTSAISNTTIGAIVLSNLNSYLDLYDGTHTGSFTVNTGSITNSGGELDCFFNNGAGVAGTGTCTLNVSGNVTMTSAGYLVGAHNHNGVVNVNVAGSVSLSRSRIYGSYGGSGNFTASFASLTMSTVSATMSYYFGSYNGTGNASLTVSGNFTNQGTYFGIYNSGVANVGTGNHTLTVNGTYTQSAGDTRGIYNMTTTNCGNSTITIGTLSFTGGYFMIGYGCNDTGGSGSLTVTGNLSVAFSNVTNIFRGNGLGTLSGSNNLQTFTCSVGGNLSISGNAAEFTSSYSQGTESTTITGNYSASAATNTFNWGAHTLSLLIGGTVTVTGGTTYLNGDNGTGTTNVNGAVNISLGTLIAKAGSGNNTTNFNSTFTQTGGTFKVFSSATNSGDTVNVNIAGDYSQSAGTVTFSDNSTATGNYNINLNGANYSISGTSAINSSGTGTLFGFLNFDRTGTIAFSRSGTPSLQQVKQAVKPECTLNVTTGNIQVASNGTAATNYFSIENAGAVILGTAQFFSNNTLTNSGIQVLDGGTLKIANTNGFYNNTNAAAISNVGNMNYYLGANSTVEYNGVDNQTVNGYGYGIATSNNHKYGILKLNFGGTADAEYVANGSDSTYVRTQLNLAAGEFNLNGKMITIESGLNSAITHSTGYINSETNSGTSNGYVKWLNLASTAYEFPFGANSTDYIPITFTPTAGIGNYAKILTRGTSTSDNTPLQGATNVSAVSHLAQYGTDVSVQTVIDRWWVIVAPGITADLVLSFRGAENTTSAANQTGTFGLQQWNGTQWTAPFGSGTGIVTGIGTITANGVSNFSPLVAVSNTTTLPIKLLSFSAALSGTQTKLTWATAEEKDNDFFTIERSTDGKNFSEVAKVDGGGTTHGTRNYATTDPAPRQGKNYYRLKQTDFDGHYTYSSIRVVTLSSGPGASVTPAGLQISSVGPNPFSKQFNLAYHLAAAGETTIRMYNMSGQLVLEEKRMDDAGDQSFDYTDNNNLPAGNYILHVVNGTEKVTRKLIKF